MSDRKPSQDLAEIAAAIVNAILGVAIFGLLAGIAIAAFAAIRPILIFLASR